MKNKSFLLHVSLLLLSVFVSSGFAHSAVSPIALSVIAPVQFPSEEFTVAGARASLLWGNHRRVYGVDLGLLGNKTSVRFLGSAIAGAANLTYGETSVLGVQFAGLANLNYQKTRVYGLQIAGGVNHNTADTSIYGLQLSLIANLSKFTTINGAQIGIYNQAQRVNGFQIGLVNVASSLRGIQIGLLNFHQQGMVSVSPIINIGF